MQVFKFGGASVKDAEAVKNVAEVLKQFPNQKLCVVISAMGKMTNALEKLANAFFYNSENANDILEEIKQFKTMLHKPIELLLARLKQANYGDAQKKQFMTTLIHTLSDELNLKDNQVAGAVRQSYKL